MSEPAIKRRILRKLKLTEISGVDRPCQEGALVTIMKRAPVGDLNDIERRVIKARIAVAKAKLQIAQRAQERELYKFWSRAAREKAAEARRKKGQPKHRWLKAAAMAALVPGFGVPLSAGYLWHTRGARYK